MDKVFLGFEVKTGKEVWLNIHHLAIFGMTQLSGKTTTLEALITRSKLRAIAFKTKRGEEGFTTFNQVTPYYKPRSDWQYVEGLLNTALREKVQYQPFMRWAILQVTKNKPKDLKEVLENSVRLEEKYPRRKEVFEQLSAYLRIVVPELEKHTFSSTLELQEGVNVMDVSDMLTETQQLVIASTIEYAFSYLDHVVVIVPEAWESLPQGRMTPIKWVAQQFIRKGAAIGNYLWLDSQDIGGIDKTPLRQCDNWLMGRMKEAHEVERILKQLLGMKVPAEEIQTLPLGHFYAAIGNDVKKVYVLPSGVPEDEGRKVAMGFESPESIKTRFLKPSQVSEDENMWKEKFEELSKQVEEIRLKAFEEGQASLSKDVIEDNKFLSNERERLQKENTELKKDSEFGRKIRELFSEVTPQVSTVSNSTQKTLLNLEKSELEVKVSHTEKTVNMTTDNQQGQILYCALNDLPKEGFTESEMSQALANRGWNIPHSSLAPQLASNLTKSGLLIKLEGRPTRYRLPTKLKISAQDR